MAGTSLSIQTAAAEPRPFAQMPRVGGLHLLRNLINAGSERIDMLGPLRWMYETYGPVVRVLYMVNLFGPEANRAVLLDKDGIFSARRPWMQIMGRIFPNGLLLRDGEDHRPHRRVMHQAFRQPVLRAYLERMNPMIERGIASWGERRDLLAFPAVKQLTFDMAASIFLGIDPGPETTRLNRAFEAMVAASMSRLHLAIPGLEFHRGLRGRRLMVRFLTDLIPRKRTGDGTDMFSLLCHAESEAGERLADQEIVDHMIFLMMAAHDTTTSTLTSLIYELARHPEWQQGVREEAYGRAGQWLEFEEAEASTVSTWAIKETMRRYPPLPVIPRIATADFVWEGWRIPAGTMVVVSPIHTHHMEAWWTDPFRWDPQRFSPERDESAALRFLWVPFGGGPHHCLGFKFAEIQIKAILHQLVRRYRWTVRDGYRMPVQQAPISKPRDGLPFHLEPCCSTEHTQERIS